MLAHAHPLLTGHRELILSGAIVLALAALLAPLPPGAIDYLIAANLAVAAGVLLAAAGPGRTALFPSLPAALLLTALLRLALGVAAARVILLEGAAGGVIEAVGAAAAGGDAVVGAVVFGVLVVVQLVVVARGSERAAEVAARFTLDAMPGAQMSIDADVRAGAIGPAEARARRGKLEQEARLHGAMDGAMKFVRGDAAAGIVLALATFLGGVVLGVTEQGMGVREAAGVYALLTVGAGVSLLVPSLMVSVGAALAVTRVDRESHGEMGSARHGPRWPLTWPRILIAAGAILGLGALAAAVAGAPWAPFVALTVITWLSAATLWRAAARESQRDAAGDGAGGATSPVTVEMHPTLTGLLAPASGGARARVRGLLDAACDDVARDLGVSIPAAAVRVNARTLAPDEFMVMIHGAAAGGGKAPRDRVVALCSAAHARARGVESGPIASAWDRVESCVVPPEAAARLRAEGIGVLSPAEFVAEHVRSALRRRAADFAGVQGTRAALDALERTHPDLVRAVTPGAMPLPQVAEVLQRLAREGVPVTGLAAILESLARWAPGARSVAALTERVRADLAGVIAHRLAGVGGRLRYYTVDPEIEDVVRASAVESPSGPAPALSYADQDRVLNAFAQGIDPSRGRPAGPVVVVSAAARPLLRALLADAMPEVSVLSYEELGAASHPEPLGMVVFAEANAG